MKATTLVTVHVEMTDQEKTQLLHFLRNYLALLNEPNEKGGGATVQYKKDLAKVIADLSGQVTRESKLTADAADVVVTFPRDASSPFAPPTTEMPAVDPRARTDEIPAQPPTRGTR